MNSNNGLALATAAMAFTLASAFANAARADLKIASEIRVTGSLAALTLGGGASGRRGQRAGNSGAGSQSAPNSTDASAPSADSTIQVTTYFKGNMARRETTGGSLVTLYDASAKRVTLINAQLKTYCSLSDRDAAKRQLDLFNLPDLSASQTAPSGMTLDTSVEVDPTGLTGTTLEKGTHKFTVYGALRLVRESQGGAGQSGGFGGRGRGRGGSRGGYPGGGGQGGSGGSGNGGSSQGGGRPPALEFDGEYWLADAAVLPSGAKSPLLPLLQQTVPDGPILAGVYGKVEHLKLIPLASKVTFGPSSLDPATRPTAVIEMNVRSIDIAPLADALFAIPEGYQKIAPDATMRQIRQSATNAQP